MVENLNIVKIGSDSINEKNLEKIIEDAKAWEKDTKEKFIFISSWAVKLGEERVLESWKNSGNFSKSSFTTIGQQFLMQMYDNLSWKEKLVWEVLLDDYLNEEFILNLIWNKDRLNLVQNFSKKFISLVQSKKDKKLVQTLLDNLWNDVWSIINHNDALSDEELSKVSSKTDNDKNAVYIAKILQDTSVKVKRVIYLTNTNWLLDENNKTVLGWKIKSEEDKIYYKNFLREEKSNSWTGWMKSKLDCSFKVLDYWVKEAIITNAKNWLECLENSKNSTKFYK